MTKRILVSVFILSVATLSYGVLIPANRLVDWTPGVSVGVPGGIPTNRTHLINVTSAPYNADKSGASDAAPAIRSAIAAATSGDIVYLPAGTYRISSLISINKSNITLRGAGDSTVIDNRSSSQAIFVGGDYQGAGVSISGSPTKGSTTITVANATNFNANDNILLSLDNDSSLPVVHVSGGTRLRAID